MADREEKPNEQEKGDSGQDPSMEEKRKHWDWRAEEFSRHAASTGYPEKFIALMDVKPDWTVFDMACGGGTLAIPLAARTKMVTAVDLSAKMLEIVRRRCDKNGLSNVRTIQGRWEDDWASLDIGPHDVVIASRSLMGENVRPYIEKLHNTAKRRVYISLLSGDGPADRRLLDAVGREHPKGHDYIHYYNLLYEMGIRANVGFIAEKQNDRWRSHEDALEDQKWMFRDMTDDEERKVRAYLKEHLVPAGGQWRLPYPRKAYWAVMWWSKGGEDEQA